MRDLDLQPQKAAPADTEFCITLLGDTIAHAKVTKNDSGDLLFSAPRHVPESVIS